MHATRPPSIILFDGVCNLCSHAVQFILARDPQQQFRFASLQSEVGQDLLRQYHVDTAALNTVILVENGRVHARSTAALRIARRLAPPWPLAYVLVMVPVWLRDAPYDFVARHRYRWFGQRDACMLPTPATRRRFLG